MHSPLSSPVGTKDHLNGMQAAIRSRYPGFGGITGRANCILQEEILSLINKGAKSVVPPT